MVGLVSGDIDVLLSTALQEGLHIVEEMLCPWGRGRGRG